MLIKLRDGDTQHAYSVHDNILPPGSPGLRPHLYRNHDEVFYVIKGTLTVRMGAETGRAPEGSFVVIPRGVVHQPSNPTDRPVHVLLLFPPGGMDRFFGEATERRLPLQAIPADPSVAAELDAFLARTDTNSPACRASSERFPSHAISAITGFEGKAPAVQWWLCR